jgi:Arc/MetJ family transcription regulator
MRTNIEIDDALMAKAMKAAGTRTKRETVERGLESLIRLKSQQGIRKLRGKVKWQGDVDAWRRD